MKNEQGFSVVEVLVAVGILATIASSALVMHTTLQTQMSSISKKTAFRSLRNQLIQTISDQNAWDVTKTMNPAMSCLESYPATCANGTAADVALYNLDGTKLTDPANDKMGFTVDGKVCNDYAGSTGNCVFQARIRWSVHCSVAASCVTPDERFAIDFKYAGPEKFNMAAYNILPRSRAAGSASQSPVLNCAKKNKYFIGLGKTVANGDGANTTADSNGCVNIVAFKGKTGQPGPAGVPGVVEWTAPVIPPVLAKTIPWCSTGYATLNNCHLSNTGTTNIYFHFDSPNTGRVSFMKSRIRTSPTDREIQNAFCTTGEAGFGFEVPRGGFDTQDMHSQRSVTLQSFHTIQRLILACYQTGGD